MFTATSPTGGAGAWQEANVITGQQLGDVSCVGSSLCVAVGTGLATSTDPVGGMSAWRSTTAIRADSISCPTTSLCVLAGDTGDVTTTTNPTGGPSAYKYTPGVDRLHPFQPGQDVSCVAGGPCVIVGGSGDAITTLDPPATRARGAPARSTPAAASTASVRVRPPLRRRRSDWQRADRDEVVDRRLPVVRVPLARRDHFWIALAAETQAPRSQLPAPSEDGENIAPRNGRCLRLTRLGPAASSASGLIRLDGASQV